MNIVWYDKIKVWDYESYLFEFDGLYCETNGTDPFIKETIDSIKIGFHSRHDDDVNLFMFDRSNGKFKICLMPLCEQNWDDIKYMKQKDMIFDTKCEMIMKEYQLNNDDMIQLMNKILVIFKNIHPTILTDDGNIFANDSVIIEGIKHDYLKIEPEILLKYFGKTIYDLNDIMIFIYSNYPEKYHPFC